MAKSSKNRNRDPSVHSRAARRAASPSDRPLADRDLNSSSPRGGTKPLKQFHAHHYGGVTKKKAKAKPLSRAQRLRREKGMERAEAVLDQLEVKTAASVMRGKKIQTRGNAWEDLNSKIAGSRGTKIGGLATEDTWEDDGEEENEGQDEEEKEVIEGVEALHVASADNGISQKPLEAKVSGRFDMEDEIL